MKRFVITLLTIFSLCVITNCSIPIGSLESGKNPNDIDSDPMWLIPRRQMYQIDDRFMRNEDFQLFIVENGGVKEIPPTSPDVTVKMTMNIGLESEQTLDVTSTHHQFYYVGRHKVTVEYQNRSGWYSVEVFSPNNGNTIGGDDGIGIIWLD